MPERNIDESKRCQFVKPDGTRCNGFRIKNSIFCYPHSPKDLRRKRNIKFRVMEMKHDRNTK